MLVDELAKRDGHLLLDCAGVVDVTRDTEQFGALVAITTEGGEPTSATADDGGRNSDSLNVGDGGWATKEADGSREWRLQARLAWLALKRLDKRGLLATDVRTHPAMEENIEVIAGTACILADQAGLVCLLNGAL